MLTFDQAINKLKLCNSNILRTIENDIAITPEEDLEFEFDTNTREVSAFTFSQYAKVYVNVNEWDVKYETIVQIVDHIIQMGGVYKIPKTIMEDNLAFKAKQPLILEDGEIIVHPMFSNCNLSWLSQITNPEELVTNFHKEYGIMQDHVTIYV